LEDRRKAWVHTLAGTNGDMSRFGVMHPCGVAEAQRAIKRPKAKTERIAFAPIDSPPFPDDACRASPIAARFTIGFIVGVMSAFTRSWISSSTYPGLSIVLADVSIVLFLASDGSSQWQLALVDQHANLTIAARCFASRDERHLFCGTTSYPRRRGRNRQKLAQQDRPDRAGQFRTLVRQNARRLA
jgi:hypothetical protein